MNSGTNGNPAVSAKGLVKGYVFGKRRIEVLRGVDIEVQRGEFVAILGASGAGKSTLLHLLAGLDAPDSGTISVAGLDLRRLGAKDLARFRSTQIGLVFQAYHLFPELDAVENVCLTARIARRDARQAEDRARHLLERVGLKDRFEHRPLELSGGEQQRVAIARALINSPDILLADEPTGNLDSHTGTDIINLLCGLHDERTTSLVIATHDQRIASRAGRILHLVDGKLAAAS